MKGMNVLIEAGRGIGDMIMLTPVIRKLKEMYPQMQITLMSSGASLAAVDGLPYVHGTCPLHGISRIANVFRKQDYVILFDYQPLLMALAKLLCVPYRIGPIKEKHKKWNLCTRYFPYSEKVTGVYQSDFYMQHIAEALDIAPFSYDAKTDVYIDQAAISSVPYERYMVIAPFARTALPLPTAMITKIVSKLVHDYSGKILFCGNDLSPSIEKIVKGDKTGRLVSLCNKTTLQEFIAILAHAEMVVTTESGPMHMSCAAGVPTISFFSIGEVERWAEKQNCYPVSIDIPCRPCASSDKQKACTHHDCMNKIPFSVVENRIDKILAGL